MGILEEYTTKPEIFKLVSCIDTEQTYLNYYDFFREDLDKKFPQLIKPILDKLFKTIEHCINNKEKANHLNYYTEILFEEEFKIYERYPELIKEKQYILDKAELKSKLTNEEETFSEE